MNDVEFNLKIMLLIAGEFADVVYFSSTNQFDLSINCPKE